MSEYDPDLREPLEGARVMSAVILLGAIAFTVFAALAVVKIIVWLAE